MLPVPFEYEAIEHDWDNIAAFLGSQNILEWRVRTARSLLSPKSSLGFRVITQLDPLDFLVYTAIVYEIAPDIEAQRLSVSDSRVFSYRFEKRADERLFNPDIGYRAFVDEAQRRIDGAARGFIAVTDIADFYPRIYHHRLENALQVATSKSSHIKALKQLLSGWNKTESYGIPVGSAPSRLLAELVITDIDQALLAQGIDFIRFNDDYRIFSQSYSEAYQALAFLAEKLFRNHGLTLQPQKTEILPTDAFHKKYLATPLDKALGSLHEKFDEIVRELGLADPYEPIDPAEISESEKAKIEALNLDKLLTEQIDSESELDIPLCRFLLRRFAQFSDSALVDKVLDNVERLYPMMPDVVNYIASLSGLQVERRKELGRKLLGQLENTLLNSLEYYRTWSLEIFAETNYWDCEELFLKLLSKFPDQFSRRKLILAMARSGTYRHWFQSQWREAENEAPWPFRALLAGLSCLPPDARKHLYQSMEPQLDPLQKAVIKWARNRPLG